METVQIVLDKGLLQATDQAARRTKRNRSALVRDALREHLRRLDIRAKEKRDRNGYSGRPQSTNESAVWEMEAVWPAELPAGTSDSTGLLGQTKRDLWSC